MISKIYVLTSAVILRCFPILLGVLVARFLGGRVYADYVFVLTLVNLLSNVPVVAINPHILSGRLAEAKGIAAFGFFFFAGFFGVILFILPPSVLLAEFREFAILYFIGSTACSLAHAVLMRAAQYRRACALSAAVILTSLGGAFVWLDGLFGPASAGRFGGLAGIFAVAGVLWLLLSTNGGARAAWEFALTIKVSGRVLFRRAGMSSIFGGLFMLGMYLVGKVAMESDSEAYRVSISLGLQLFGVTVFIPGALGSYFVPRVATLASEREKHRFARRYLKAYLFTGILALLVVAAILPWVLGLYGIPAVAPNVGIVLIIQAAAVVAAANAALTQFCISVGAFEVLVASAVVWFSVLLLCVSFSPPDGLALPGALAFAYVASFLYVRYVAFRCHGSKTR